MSSRSDEIEAAMHPTVLNALTVETDLGFSVLLKLLVDVICHRFPARVKSTQRLVMVA